MNKKYPFVSTFLFLIIGIVTAQMGLNSYWLLAIICIYGYFLKGKWWVNYGILLVLIIPAWAGFQWMLQAKLDAIQIDKTLRTSQAILIKVHHVDVLNFKSNSKNVNLKAQIVGSVLFNKLEWLPETDVLIQSPREDFEKWNTAFRSKNLKGVELREMGEFYLIEGWKYSTFKNQLFSEFKIQTFKSSQWISVSQRNSAINMNSNGSFTNQKSNDGPYWIGLNRNWNLLRGFLESRVLKKVRPNLSEQGWNMFLKLMLGQKGAIDKQEMKFFQKAGIVHVLSVSGMHVALIFSVLFWPLKWIRWKWLHRIAWVIVLFIIWIYGTITGMSPPVERAVWAITYSQIGQFVFNRKVWTPDAFFVIGCLQLAINPLVLFDLGFQLSYAAMLGIALVVPIYNEWMFQFEWPKWKEYLISGLVISLICSITTLPFVLYYFKQFSNWFFIGNLLLIPVFTVLIYSYLVLFVLSFLGILDGLNEFQNITVGLFDGMISLIRKLLQFIDQLPYGYSYGPNFNLTSACALSFLIICWIHRMHFPNERKWTIWAVFPFLFLVSL